MSRSQSREENRHARRVTASHAGVESAVLMQWDGVQTAAAAAAVAVGPLPHWALHSPLCVLRAIRRCCKRSVLHLVMRFVASPLSAWSAAVAAASFLPMRAKGKGECTERSERRITALSMPLSEVATKQRKWLLAMLLVSRLSRVSGQSASPDGASEHSGK